MQTIVENIKHLKESQIILSAMHRCILDLYLDPHGSHVLEKVVECYDIDEAYFIYDLVIQNFMLMATNPNGLAIIKKVLVMCSNNKLTNVLLYLMKQYSHILIEHVYGNYTLQTILEV